MIKLDNVVATYTTQRGHVNAVDGVDLEIPDSIILGIAGESGCGKSTLMKVIYGDTGFPQEVVYDPKTGRAPVPADARTKGAKIKSSPPRKRGSRGGPRSPALDSRSAKRCPRS